MARYILFPVILSILLLGTSASAALLNNIIRFGSLDARQEYIDHVKQQNPNVEIELLNNIFIGLITKHTDASESNQEFRMLNDLVVSQSMSILGFERDQEYKASAISQPSPPWHLDRIDQREPPLDDSFKFDDSEDEINVYVADTGIHVTHSEFEGRAKGAFSAFSGEPAGEDGHGHGTHVASLVGGRVSGALKNAKLWAVRVLDRNGSGSTSGILKGMDWVAKNGKRPAILNMSLGGGYSRSLNDAVQSLTQSGVLSVVAAGNENTDACSKSPASAPSALTIGATDKNDQRSSFSNYGSCVDLYAPGSNIRAASHRSNSGFTTMSGTSMASPISCGIAATILQKNPNLSPADLTTKVLEAATDSVDSDIRPFAYYDVSSSGPEPPQPEPPQPESGLVAFVEEGPLLEISNAEYPASLDASMSHVIGASCDMKVLEGLSYEWSCKGAINHSEKNPFCDSASFPGESTLELSAEQLQEIQRAGPVMFSVQVSSGDERAMAHTLVSVE